jgi:Family of unknown function (DUF5677)
MKPVEDFLSRKSEVEVVTFLATIADSIDETVNFGTHIFQWFNEAVTGRADEVVPIAVSFKHLLDMLDAISVLIRNSIVEPAKIHLRSALESAMTIEWILQDDSERRAMAFMVCNVHQELKFIQKIDEQTPQGKQFKQKLKGTPAENVQAPPSVDIEKDRQNREALLLGPKYREAEEEYQRLIAQKEKNPSWYRLFDGPNNLEQLASKVGMIAWYEVFYHQWSGLVHATDLLGGKVKTTGGKTLIQKMRYPGGVEQVYVYTIAIALQVYKKMLEQFAPSKIPVFLDWYESEVRDFYLRLNSGNPVIVSKVT